MFPHLMELAEVVIVRASVVFGFKIVNIQNFCKTFKFCLKTKRKDLSVYKEKSKSQVGSK